ncbi:hypothetical protein [Flavobacterium sp. ZB4P13]|uniref:hypothetical protein n=1 Tax=Flavobacterium sp. ZB4P13 TaxID=3401728 RepID=UPI003AAE81D4
MEMSNRLASENKRYFLLFLGIGSLHFIMTIIYYYLSEQLTADSIAYYYKTSYVFKNWKDTFGQGTYFIYFLVYPLVKYLGLTYLGCFFIFSFVGLIAFYKLFKVYSHLLNNEWNKWLYLLLLPNMHFWSVAIGKDVLMFYGFSVLLYNYYFKKPVFNYVFPLLLMGFIRIHVVFFFFAALVIVQLFFNKEMKFYLKVLLITVVSGIVLMTMPFFLEMVGAGENASIPSRLDMFEAQQFEGRSSVNMQGENIIYKWVSYLFRPLFYDIHNFLSLTASFENLLWVIMFYTIVKYYKLKSVPRLKQHFWFGVLMIICVTLPAAYILTNIGIAVRQKYMISPFLLFIFYIVIIDKTTHKYKKHSNGQIFS